MQDEEVKTEPEESKGVVFKRKKPKRLRQRKCMDDPDEEEDLEEVNHKLEEMKELQSLRKRPRGVDIVGLALGTKAATHDDNTKDPFKVKSGGMVNMDAFKGGKMKQVDDAYDTGIGTQFSVETNKRDEDEEMMKYIEVELSKKKSRNTENVPNQLDNLTSYTSPEEAALQAVPDHLRESSTKRSEEMLSNQMLNGIPEVDLGIEAKIRNIEATEEAKLKLLWEKQNKKDGPSHFVPTNMAADFLHHNRFNIEDVPRRKQHSNDRGKGIGAQGKSQEKKDEKATDDYHYERFKKQFRRH